MWVFRRAKSLSSIHERSILYTFLPAYHNKNTIYNLFHFLYMSFNPCDNLKNINIEKKVEQKTQFESIYKLNLLLEREQSEFSGLASMPTSVEQKLRDNKFDEDYRTFILIMFTKGIYYTFRKKVTNEELLENAALYYSDILHIFDRKINKQLYTLFERKGSSLTQHVCMFILRNRKFDLNILQKKYENIDLSYHKDFTYNLCLELYVFNKINSVFIGKNKPISIDFNSPIMSYEKIKKNNPYRVLHENEPYNYIDEDVKYSEDKTKSLSPHNINESQDQLTQPNSDFVQQNYHFLSNNEIFVEHQYFEVKNDQGGPLDGRCVIVPGISRSSTILRRFITNYMTRFIEIGNKSETHIKPIFKDFVDTLKDLLDDFKQDPIDKIYKKFLKELLSRLTGLSFKQFNLSIPLESDLDKDFVQLYYQIEPNIKKNLNLLDWGVVYPKYNLNHNEKSINLIKDIIILLLPKEMQNELLENVDEFFRK
jgi:hypothetical protein